MKALFGTFGLDPVSQPQEAKMVPSPGRTVQYTLSEQDADAINRRREDARKSRSGSGEHFGFIFGNEARAGDNYPMVITRVWNGDQPATEQTSVNGQVLLDGNDTLWVTSRQQGDGEYHWREFPRV